MRLLKPGGAFSYITSNKWYRAKYGENLRHWMNVNARLHTLIDFGDANVFDAIAYPTIILAERRAEPGPKPEDRFRALNWQDLGESAQVENFPALVTSAGFDMPQSTLTKSGWQIEPTVKREMLARIRASGVPLGDYVEGRFYYGIKTGYNDAFVIDGDTRARLIAADPKSAEIIKPFLRGRDVKRWRVEPQDLWLIFTRRGIEIDRYPAVKRHLEQYREALEPKPSGWKGGEWPGRKAGSYKWYEIQDNVAYWEEFIEPKIIVPAIEKTVAYAPDTGGFFSNDKTSIIVSDDWRYLSSCLNSPVSWWVAQTLYASRQGGFFEFKPMYVGQFPIPKADDPAKKLIGNLVDILCTDFTNLAVEQLLNGFIYELYFPQEIHARGLTLLDAATVTGLGKLSEVKGEALMRAAESFIGTHLAPGQQIRLMLSDLQTLDVVRTIEGRS
jgi:hypothetical protein